MTQTAEDRRTAGRELAQCIFGKPGKTAGLNLDDLAAAVGVIDDTFDLLPTDASLNTGKSLKGNFLDLLPEPFASTATNPEKALALHVWALKETNQI